MLFEHHAHLTKRVHGPTSESTVKAWTHLRSTVKVLTKTADRVCILLDMPLRIHARLKWMLMGRFNIGDMGCWQDGAVGLQLLLLS